MNNKEIIIKLTKIFDNLDANYYAFGDSTSEVFGLKQFKNGEVRYTEVGYLPFRLVKYTLINPDRVYNLKRQLKELYTFCFNGSVFIEIKIINNGFAYRVIDYTLTNTKVISKGKLIFTSRISILYYLILLFKKQ